MIFEVPCGGNEQQVKAFMACLLNLVAQRNREILTESRFPPLYQSGVRYGVDPDIAQVQRLLTVEDIMARRPRIACCKSLCCWRVAELRNAARSEQEAALIDFEIEKEDFDRDPIRVGLQPNAHGLVRLWHVNVVRADGRVENPSRRLRR